MRPSTSESQIAQSSQRLTQTAQSALSAIARLSHLTLTNMIMHTSAHTHFGGDPMDAAAIWDGIMNQSPSRLDFVLQRLFSAVGGQNNWYFSMSVHVVPKLLWTSWPPKRPRIFGSAALMKTFGALVRLRSSPDGLFEAWDCRNKHEG